VVIASLRRHAVHLSALLVVSSTNLHGPLKILGIVVLAVMAAALLYAAYIAIANWAHIAV
jgi:hypothetical protein